MRKRKGALSEERLAGLCQGNNQARRGVESHVNQIDFRINATVTMAMANNSTLCPMRAIVPSMMPSFSFASQEAREIHVFATEHIMGSKHDITMTGT